MWTLLFDIDGTILRSAGAGMTSLNEAFKEHFQLDSVAVVEYQGRPDRSIADDLMKAHAIEHTEENFQRIMQSYYQRLPQYLEKANGHVLPGVRSIIETLSMRDEVAMGLITGNTRLGARVKLQHYQLSHYFEFGGFGEDHFDRNEVAEQAVAEAQDRYGDQFSIDRCWIIGDTPLDITCARHVGASVLAVCTGNYGKADLLQFQPDALMEDLSDVDAVIKTLTSSPRVSA